MSLYLTCRVSAQHCIPCDTARGRLGQASPQWVFHRETSLSASLLGMEAPLIFRDKGQRAMDDMSAFLNFFFVLHSRKLEADSEPHPCSALHTYD